MSGCAPDASDPDAAVVVLSNQSQQTHKKCTTSFSFAVLEVRRQEYRRFHAVMMFWASAGEGGGGVMSSAPVGEHLQL